MNEPRGSEHLDSLEIWIGVSRAREVSAWASGRGIQFEAERLLTSGLSGSVVGLVTERSMTGQGDRRVVFKMNPDGANADEGALHNAAYDAVAVFGRKHLVKLVAPPHTLSDKSSITLQEFAGGDIGVWQPLSSLSGLTDMTSCLATIATSMVKDWNPGSKIRSASAADFLGPRVAQRYGPSGVIRTWLSEEFGAEVLVADWLTFSTTNPSRTRVNPGILLREDTTTPTTNALVGNSHGDLHMENILLPVAGGAKPSRYRLIDMAHYSAERSLTHDPANLLLSEVERILVAWQPSLTSALLTWIDSREDTQLPTELAGIAAAWRATEGSGLENATKRAYAGEWKAQFWLSICASALVLSSRSRLSTEMRVWFFELASIATTKWLEIHNALPIESDPVLVGPDLNKASIAARDVARSITSGCSNFDSAVVSIAIVPRDALEKDAIENLSRAGWDVLLDFDTLTNEPVGNFRNSKETWNTVNLLEPAQVPSWSRNTTTWIAGAGLAPVGATEDDVLPYLKWRQRYLDKIVQIVKNLSSTYSTPFKIVIFGKPDDYVRAIVDSVFDAAGDRTSVTIISSEESVLLASHEATNEIASASKVAVELSPKYPSKPALGAPATLPGKDGRLVVLSESDRAYLEDGYDVLHSAVAMVSQAVDGVGIDFYSGRKITWFELQSDVDLLRNPASSSLDRALKAKLAKRSTDQHVFVHFPGAGGTTTARRAAWDLRTAYPVLVVDRATDSDAVADRVELIAKLTDHKVLIVIESMSLHLTERLYKRLRSNSVPSLMLLVSRATNTRNGTDPAYLLPPMDADEVRDFNRFFGGMKPERRASLAKIGSTGPEDPVPFLYALTAFRDDFVGLNEYVKRFIIEIDDNVRRIVIATAMAHRYGPGFIHSNIFTLHLHLPQSQPVSLNKQFSGKLDGLILEDRTGYWRTPHSLIAEQILRECLSPIEGRTRHDRDAWKSNLADSAEDLILLVSTTTTGQISDDADDLLQQLFIKREVRYDGDKARYSELIEAIPSEARERVFQKLTEEFPEEAHFLAHFSRWQSSEPRNHSLARKNMSKAIELRGDDSIIWHMKGTNCRRELYDYLDDNRHLDSDHEVRRAVRKHVEELAFEALEDYENAADLDDTSSYPLISSAELCLRVIEWGKLQDSAASYAQFLKKPNSAFFVELLDIAEERARAVTEIEGNDEPSTSIASVRARMTGIYDDYSGMIEGWRNILDTTKGSKSALRVRLARLYGYRNGGWNKATKGDVEAALVLLNESLSDDPSNGHTVRLWLDAARFKHTSLARAIETVSRWVDNDSSRDALYFDYVLTALHALQGGLASADDLSRKVDLIKRRSQDFQQKRTVFDWLGTGQGLGQLVNKSEVKDWDQRSLQTPPLSLLRVDGRINRIDSPTRGTIILANNIEAFFAPSRSAGNDFIPGRDKNSLVTAVIGFSYDGIQAWNVLRK